MNNNQMRDEIVKILDEYHEQVENNLPITYDKEQIEKLEEYVNSYNRFNEISEQMKNLETKDNEIGSNNIPINNAEGREVLVNQYDVDKYFELLKEKTILKKAQTKAVNYFESHTIADIIDAVRVEPVTKEVEKQTTQNMVDQVEKLLNELSNRGDFTAEQATAINILASQITQNKLANLNLQAKNDPKLQSNTKENENTKANTLPSIDYQNMSIDELKQQANKLKLSMDELRNLTGKENAKKVMIGNKQHEAYSVPEQYKEQAKQIYNEMQKVRKVIEEKTKQQVKDNLNQAQTQTIQPNTNQNTNMQQPVTTQQPIQSTVGNNIKDEYEKPEIAAAVSNSKTKLFGVHSEADPLFKDFDRKETETSKNYYRIYDEEGERLNREYEQQKLEKANRKVSIKKIKKPEFGLKQRIMENWKQTKSIISAGLATLSSLANHSHNEPEEDYEIDEQSLRRSA